MTADTFCVVIPARNEAARLKRCLPALMAALGEEAGRVDVVLADNHSTDDTRDVAAALGARVVMPAERVSIAALRNFGAAEARGDILLFLDADMEPPPDWFTAVKEHFSQDLDVLGFVEDVPVEAPWFARIWSERTRARRAEFRQVDFLPGRNICVRRHFFEKVGGLDAGLRTSEDKDFVMRLVAAGAKAFSAPAPNPVHWGYEKTWAELTRKEFWRQSSHIAMMKRHGFKARLMRFPGLAALHALWPGAIVAGFILAPLWGWVAVALWPASGLVQALSQKLSRTNAKLLGQFTLLYWLRLTVAGYAVLMEGLTGLRPQD